MVPFKRFSGDCPFFPLVEGWEGSETGGREITEDAAATMKVTEDTARRQIRKILGSRLCGT